jgi:hypothetical protein
LLPVYFCCCFQKKNRIDQRRIANIFEKKENQNVYNIVVFGCEPVLIFALFNLHQHQTNLAKRAALCRRFLSFEPFPKFLISVHRYLQLELVLIPLAVQPEPPGLLLIL